MQTQKPSPGRIVLFVAPNGELAPAVITKVAPVARQVTDPAAQALAGWTTDDAVDLEVFGEHPPCGARYWYGVRQDQEQAPLTWHFPTVVR